MKKLYILLIAIFGLNATHAQWVPQNSGTTNILYSVCFTDANTGYIGGSDSHLLKTLDGGTTWDTTYTLAGPGFNSVFFTDANTGYAAGEGFLFKTIDAGLTWTNQMIFIGEHPSVFSPMQILDILCI
jgi:photosystem II stability/assembly factor-like uncharacterized protein